MSGIVFFVKSTPPTAFIVSFFKILCRSMFLLRYIADVQEELSC